MTSESRDLDSSLISITWILWDLVNSFNFSETNNRESIFQTVKCLICRIFVKIEAIFHLSLASKVVASINVTIKVLTIISPSSLLWALRWLFMPTLEVKCSFLSLASLCQWHLWARRFWQSLYSLSRTVPDRTSSLQR